MTTLHVSNRRGLTWQYKTIAAAVEAAAPGDTITIAPGKYIEDVRLDKSIQIVGKSAAQDKILIDGGFEIFGFDVVCRMEGIEFHGNTARGNFVMSGELLSEGYSPEFLTASLLIREDAALVVE